MVWCRVGFRNVVGDNGSGRMHGVVLTAKD